MKTQKKSAPVGGNRTRGRAIKSNFSLMDFGAVVKDGIGRNVSILSAMPNTRRVREVLQ